MAGVAIQAFNGQVISRLSEFPQNGWPCPDRSVPTRPAEKGKLKMGLENKYRQADDTARALKAKIWKAAAEFVRLHPEFLPSAANEKILLDCMGAPENDHLNPVHVSAWEDAYAQSRGKLYEPPAVKRQPRRAAPVAPVLTRAEVDSWSAKQLQREMESSPHRAEEIEAALARR
jgi:hypothetical protein